MPNRFRLKATTDPLVRPPSNVMEPKRIIFISSEGTETEPSYFKHLAEILQDNGVCTDRIEHLERERKDGAVDPDHVLSLIEECRSIRQKKDVLGFIGEKEFKKLELEYSPKEIDEYIRNPDLLSKHRKSILEEVCLKLNIDVGYRRYLLNLGNNESKKDVFVIVLDRDSGCHKRETLERIRKFCEKEGIIFCISNPCFDFWLLLHLKSRFTINQLQGILRNEYVSDKYTFTGKMLADNGQAGKTVTDFQFAKLYRHSIKKALKRSERYKTRPIEVLDGVGTSMPLLMNLIIRWIG